MARVRLRAYTSPTLVLLAMDWPEAAAYPDFLGFSIKRTPGFRGAEPSWLTNRIGFDGPPPNNQFLPSLDAPIQKFMWWDAQIDTPDRGKTFTYEVWPVRGTREDHPLVDKARNRLSVTLPNFVEGGVGTWFNRAVVSSQSFSRLLLDLGVRKKADLTPEKERRLRTWLANGLETVVPEFLGGADAVLGAVYHLEDRLWVVPALAGRTVKTELVYDARKEGNQPSSNEKVVAELRSNQHLFFSQRTRAKIMHNKLLVAVDGQGHARRVLCGSANFTTGGLTSQANVLHVLQSRKLATFYRDRIRELWSNPTLSTLAARAQWSGWTRVGGAYMRVCFAPEGRDQRLAIAPIVEAIRNARSSVVFCLFTPTDRELRDECFAAGDRGLMMFGLVNRISAPKPIPEGAAPGPALRDDELAQVELYHRSKSKRDVVSADLFERNEVPAGFLEELKTLPGSGGGRIPPVIVHHKFVVIDAEGDNPIVFTGSANMSKSSQYSNDENLLHIRGSKRIAGAYLAEFMRLYEHYRARAQAPSPQALLTGTFTTFRLAPNARWARKHFTPGTPEARARTNMAD